MGWGFKGRVMRRIDQSLFKALAKHDMPSVEELTHDGANVHAKEQGGRSALHVACAYRWQDGVAFLLARGVDPNAKDDSGNTPLHQIGLMNLVAAQDDILRLMVDAGADINAVNKDGETVLMQVASHRLVDDLRYLSACITNINIGDRRGFTALHKAISANVPNAVRIANVKVLLEAGADPHQKTRTATPLSALEFVKIKDYQHAVLSDADKDEITCCIETFLEQEKLKREIRRQTSISGNEDFGL